MLLGVATFAISLWALIESLRSIHGTATHFWSVVAQAQTQVRTTQAAPWPASAGEVHRSRASKQYSCRAQHAQGPQL
jgi:hypothetical protein